MTIADRFWEKVVGREDPDGCWIWTATRQHGYGYFSVRGRLYRAHRFAYTLLVGPIPKGLTLDHLCRDRACVNPAHLEPVTMRENVLRGVGPTAAQAAKTHCKHGHEFTQENTYVPPNKGGRECRTCRQESGRRRRQLAKVGA